MFRAAQLEKRLEEKLQENEDLRRQLDKANSLLAESAAKDEKTKDRGRDMQIKEKIAATVTSADVLQLEAVRS